MSDTIKVRFTAQQTVFYDQTREIPRVEWEKYQQLIAAEAREREFTRMADIWIEPADVVDADDYEDFEMRVVE